ncbi:MAG: hypothetical protein IPL55_10915 [Saprospiraceae bacterium]|nr:hypothetical protein [Saprospiraceae bacterium]
MQWFNQIDPRDPLQLTNGVVALTPADITFKTTQTFGFGYCMAMKHYAALMQQKLTNRFLSLDMGSVHPVPKGEIAMLLITTGCLILENYPWYSWGL